MAKSLRSKREKRLRTIRREIVEPFYDKKTEAKLAAQQAALDAPKLPARSSPNDAASMDLNTATTLTNTTSASMDVEMGDGNQNLDFLKPVGGIGKKSKRKFKVGKRRVKGKLKRNRHI